MLPWQTSAGRDPTEPPTGPRSPPRFDGAAQLPAGAGEAEPAEASPAKGSDPEANVLCPQQSAPEAAESRRAFPGRRWLALAAGAFGAAAAHVDEPASPPGSPRHGHGHGHWPGRGCCADYAEHFMARRDLMRLVCLWAVAAETLGHCWFSIAGARAAHWDICHAMRGFSDGDKYMPNPDALAGAYSIIFCNLLGTFVMGGATVWIQERMGPKSHGESVGLQTAMAVKLGFCPCITTFPGAVQVSVSLVEHGAAAFAVASLFGGPILFGAGAKFTRWILDSSTADCPSGALPDRAVSAALAVFITASAVLELGRAPLALLCGWLMAVAACLVSDILSVFVPTKQLWGVHWETVIANLFALSLVAGDQTASSFLKLLQSDSNSVTAIITGKFQTTFCGTVSAYSSFAGDVMNPIMAQGLATGWRQAVLTWTVNVATGIFFMGFFFDGSSIDDEVVGLTLHSLGTAPRFVASPAGFGC